MTSLDLFLSLVWKKPVKMQSMQKERGKACLSVQPSCISCAEKQQPSHPSQQRERFGKLKLQITSHACHQTIISFFTAESYRYRETFICPRNPASD